MAQDPPPTAAATPPASPVAPPTAQGQPDWATQVTDTIDQYVGLVRDRTTKPAVVIARGLVFGIMLAVLGITAIVLAWIALTTGLTALTGKAWITDAILGGIFVILGAFLMSKRRPKEMDFDAAALRTDESAEHAVSDVRNVIIIGSGPAGLTAAVDAARANLAPLVIEGEPSSTSDQPGGQLMLTTDVENFPGFPEGIMGPELMLRMRDQAARFGAEFLTQKVTAVDVDARPFKVWVRDQEFQAHSLIVSTGAQSLMLGLEAEHRLIGHGLSTCATCDGFFFREHEIAVVGGGDSAIEEAIFLTKFAKKVILIHRRDSLRASKIMQERAFANPKIEFLWDSQVVDLLGDTKLEGALVRNVNTGDEHVLPVTGLFVAIGHRPNTDLFKGLLDMEDNGYLVTAPGSTATNVDGVFACGDVQDHIYRQAITAAGSGCMAAIDAERWLEANHHG